MPAQPDVDGPRCADPECRVCDLSSRPLDAGAERVSRGDLIEHACRLRVQAGKNLRCTHGLRIDVPEAGYRLVSKGRTTRMCDFAVLAAAAGTAPLWVAELKSGAAYAEEVLEHLAEGLRVLHEHYRQDGLDPRPGACIVAGKEPDKLRRSLGDKLGALRFGERRLPLRILECGDSLRLP